VKRLLSVILVAVLVLAAATTAWAQIRVGIAMPTQSLQRWNQDGANMKQRFE